MADSANRPMGASHQSDAFLNPQLGLGSLDYYLVRKSILEAIENAVSNELSGDFLDVGAGFQPYRSLIEPKVDSYTALDLDDNGPYDSPDAVWDGIRMPFEDNSFDSAMATEVFEHCPDPEITMKETARVLRPGGVLFFTVPFLWPLHCVPHDEYRYTPFALQRHLENSGFGEVELQALGGWNAALAQMIGLWTRRSPMPTRRRRLLSALALPIVRVLAGRDAPPTEFGESTMITGFAGIARTSQR